MHGSNLRTIVTTVNFSPGRSSARRAIVVCGLLLSAVVVATPLAGATPTYPAADVTFYGHGFGPGIGMGQWGAFGYAEQEHESYQWILAHFYGGTKPGTVTDPEFSVAITGNAGSDVVVTSGAPFSVGSLKFSAGQATRLVLTGASSRTYAIQRGASCSAKSWATVGSGVQPVVVPSVTGGTAPPSEILTLCRGNGVHEAMRGDIQAIDSGGRARTNNVLPLEEYLRGVVPSEMPWSWGDAGSAGPQSEPWGFQALEAQAVAARSYAWAYMAAGGWEGQADICDSDCQSYTGVATENALTDAAVADTAGHVLDSGGSTVASTQYSSSDGGYTAASAFPPVVDAGDSICLQTDDFTCNTLHDWTASVPVAAVQGAFPQVGELTSVAVTERNGLGDLGGRVLTVEVSGTKGSVAVSGWDFAAEFISYGMYSNWFAVTNGAGGRSSGLLGYWLGTARGGVSAFGSTPTGGSLPPASLAGPIVAMATAPAGGYWLAGSNGGVHPHGKAGWYGSMGGHHLNSPIVGMAESGDGYWLVAADGGVFTFGAAHYLGSMGGHHLNKPIVGMAATADGKGYWLVASDGGIFTFGDAHFVGSAGAIHLNKPVVGMAPGGGSLGYWLVASDGGVFGYGNASFYGSLGGKALPAPAVAMVPTPNHYGYEILTADGDVHPFGDAPQYGDLATRPDSGAAVGIAAWP
jgi:SpoIID/LytB domain protein